MQEVKVTVNGGIISDEELQEYIKRGRLQQPHNELVAITVTLDDDYVDIDYKYANHLMPQRFSIAGDMIVPTFENLNKQNILTRLLMICGIKNQNPTA